MSIARLIKSGVVRAGFAAAVTLMASSAMADASSQPMQLAALTEGFDAEATYKKTCFMCHNAGVSGAPRLNTPGDWTARLEKGFDAVFENALNGLNNMPAKGMCFTCTDEDLKAVVQYMVDNSQ